MDEFPTVRRVRQSYDQPVVADIEREVRRQILGSKVRQRLPMHARVALAVGSRGINNLQAIVKATIRTLESLNVQPFVVAAMGTHGGGTSDGQRLLLAEYGITEDALGVPVATDMEAEVIGVNELGAKVYWDKNALAADAVIAINRVKAHTDFSGPIESGILKMLVIGLGKRESPKQVHSLGSQGMAKMVPASAKVVLATTKFALGLALVENAAEQTALIRAIEPDQLFDVEPTLLKTAKEWMGRLPFDECDTLIVGELGKNYSGTGLDPNVIGRRYVETEADFATPRIVRLAVLDIARESHGNAIGAGFADLTTQRFVEDIDHPVVQLNVLTAQLLLRARIPMALRTDRDVIRAAIETCWQPDPTRVRLALIANTLELSELYVTDALAAHLRAPGGRLEIGDPEPLRWRDDDRLDQPAMFPHATQGRRKPASLHHHAQE